MTNKLFTATIVILVLVAVGLGYFIYRQKSGGPNDLLFERRFSSSDSPQSEDTSDTQAGAGDEKKEFLLVLGENTQLFGIAKENPYYGEPPASTSIGGDAVQQPSSSFEIWGDVLSVDKNEKAIRISSDAPRPINTPFTPRGPRVSLQDIKAGDRIVASSAYNENGEADYTNIQFIQITPSVEEIKRLRESQGK
ncbi:MAG: hypothetical protein Greene071421_512 [Parcubacteria group bacterium Greene0714_21]|nr:MAG: hypothetical protein Greene071421_512 [Parcubacteria group bacterium Greene0714_21]